MSDDPKSRFPWLSAGARYHVTGLKYLAQWRGRGRGLEAAARFVRAKVFPYKTILFYPDRPGLASTIYKACAILGYRISTDPSSPADGSVLYKYATHVDVPRGSGPIPDDSWLNWACRDISKRRVQAAFHQTFEYPLAVDPTRFDGDLLEKRDENAVKDATIRRGPLAPEDLREGYVYERLVNNVAENGDATTYRVPVIDGEVPFVIVGVKPPDRRFREGGGKSVRLVDADRCFSPDELDRLTRFCEVMGLDFVELDVVRDVDDGRVYVVDANSTPHTSTRRLSPDERVRFLGALANAFDAALERRAAGRHTKAPGPRAHPSQA